VHKPDTWSSNYDDDDGAEKEVYVVFVLWLVGGLFGAHRIYLAQPYRAVLPTFLTLLAIATLLTWTLAYHATVVVDAGGIFGALGMVASVLALAVWIVDGTHALLFDVAEYNVTHRDLSDDSALRESLMHAGYITHDDERDIRRHAGAVP